MIIIEESFNDFERIHINLNKFFFIVHSINEIPPS